MEEERDDDDENDDNDDDDDVIEERNMMKGNIEQVQRLGARKIKETGDEEGC